MAASSCHDLWMVLLVAAVMTTAASADTDVHQGNSVVPLKSCNEVEDWSFARCDLHLRKDNCKSSRRYMETWCPKTCGFCQGTALAPIKCQVTKFGCCSDQVTPAKGPNAKGCPEKCADEQHLNCARLLKFGYCVTHFDAMRRRCPKTCNFCGRMREGNCFNVLGNGRCDKLFTYGMCDVPHWKKMMGKYCRKACGQCIGDVPKLKEVAPKCASEGGCCWDRLTPLSQGCPACADSQSSLFCGRFKSECFAVGKISNVQMRMLCPKTCGMCSVVSSCRDDTVYGTFCAYWKKAKHCVTDPIAMSMFCSKTCDFC